MHEHPGSWEDSRARMHMLRLSVRGPMGQLEQLNIHFNMRCKKLVIVIMCAHAATVETATRIAQMVQYAATARAVFPPHTFLSSEP
jgi:hypothetical protein